MKKRNNRKFMILILVVSLLLNHRIPRIQAQTSTEEWQCIYFGSYYQNDTNADGVIDSLDDKEPIRWRVLSRSGTYALLLSDRILDGQKYNVSGEACTWETCSIRTWLNDTFYHTAFNSSEQEAIQIRELVNTAVHSDLLDYICGGNVTWDKVYLLSHEDIVNTEYFGNYRLVDTTDTRTTTNTAYAATKPAMYSNTTSADVWWLRGPGQWQDTALQVMVNGHVSSLMMVGHTGGVRPVIYVDLSDTSLWSDAGIATAVSLPQDGIINEEEPVTDKESEKEDAEDTGTSGENNTSQTISVSAPTAFKQKSATTNSLELTWKKDNGVSYEIYRSTKKNNGYKKIATVSTNSYTDKKLKAGTTYYYKVCAVKTVSGKTYNSSDSSILKAVTKPSKAKVTLKAGKIQIKISWKKVTGAEKYEVYLATSKKGKYKKLITTNETKYTKKKLKKGKKYYIKVRSYITDGSGQKYYSAYSSIKSVKVK